MAIQTRWRRLRILVPLALLGMILMRLVWLQIRTYPVIPGARAVITLNVLEKRVDDNCEHDHPFPLKKDSLKYDVAEFSRAFASSAGLLGIYNVGCIDQKLSDRQLAKFNQWIFMGTVLLVALFARFATSSWTIALIAAIAVLSRGRILTELGYVSIQGFLIFGFTAFMTGAAHFVRTGSYGSLIFMIFAAFLSSLLDRSFMALFTVFPVLLIGGYVFRKRLSGPVLKRLRNINRQRRRLAKHERYYTEPETGITKFMSTSRYMLGLEFPRVEAKEYRLPSYARGGMFKTIEVPFALWAFSERRWLRLVLGWGFCGAIASLVLLGAYIWLLQPYWGLGSDMMLRNMDTNLGGALASWNTTWFSSMLLPFDIHLTVSMIVIVACILQSPADGLNNFWDATWLLIIALAGILGLAYFADLVEAMMVESLVRQQVLDSLIAALKPRSVFTWAEPLIITMGICGVYNLLKVIDSKSR